MMAAFLFLAVLGAALVVLGVNSIKNPILWYNRAKVPEENKTIFGMIGICMMTAMLAVAFCIYIFTMIKYYKKIS